MGSIPPFPIDQRPKARQIANHTQPLKRLSFTDEEPNAGHFAGSRTGRHDQAVGSIRRQMLSIV